MFCSKERRWRGPLEFLSKNVPLKYVHDKPTCPALSYELDLTYFNLFLKCGSGHYQDAPVNKVYWFNSKNSANSSTILRRT